MKKDKNLRTEKIRELQGKKQIAWETINNIGNKNDQKNR